MGDEIANFHVIEHTPDSDVLRSYGGMTESAVRKLLAEGGNSFDFIDAATHAELLNAQSDARAAVSEAAPSKNGMEVQVVTAEDRIAALEVRISAIEASLSLSNVIK